MCDTECTDIAQRSYTAILVAQFGPLNFIDISAIQQCVSNGISYRIVVSLFAKFLTKCVGDQ